MLKDGFNFNNASATVSFTYPPPPPRAQTGTAKHSCPAPRQLAVFINDNRLRLPSENASTSLVLFPLTPLRATTISKASFSSFASLLAALKSRPLEDNKKTANFSLQCSFSINHPPLLRPPCPELRFPSSSSVSDGSDGGNTC